MRIVVGLPQVPFFWGGAERLASGLVNALQRDGYQATLVTMPFKWYPHVQLIRSMLMWRMVDLTESNGVTVDLYIGTKFPAYLARHTQKVVWLVHQYRQAYDWYGTPMSDLGATASDIAVRQMVQSADRRGLSEARKVYAISSNVASRLKKFLGLDAEPLYPPTTLQGLEPQDYGDFILSVGRLDRPKRIDLLLRSLALCRQDIKAVVVGTGPQERELRGLAARLGLRDRVEFVGHLDDSQLVKLYNTARFVWYAPLDEDYGYVTVEALTSGKPVVTAEDAGGVLEFVEDGVTGLVAEPEPGAQAAALEALWAEPQRARALGQAGRDRVAGITWSKVVERLLR